MKNIRVFISYKKRKEENGIPHGAKIPPPPQAADIFKYLTEQGYDVFIDDEMLKTGTEWARSIFENIYHSDVLIVLLEEETAKSDWVQREVDMARGAQVRILPLGIDPDVNIHDTLTRLALHSIQFIAEFKSTDDHFLQLMEDIDRLARETRAAQRRWSDKLRDRWQGRRAEPNKHCASFVLAENEKRFKVHVAAGDMTSRALGGIEVLVNTENDYMQMARIFESSTLSSSIRREGAHFNMGRLQEDTVQKMLDAKVEELLDETCGRPLMLGEVLYTPAGHALSDLRKNGARYILHAATVRVESITMRDQLRAIETSTGIERTIFNCFEAVKEIDANKGVICPPPWQEEQEKAKGSYQNIESIIFPVFGTGHGGRSVTEVLPEMARAIRDYLMDHADDNEFHIKDVYLCVYAAPDVDDAIWAFSERRGFKCIAGDCATGKTADKKEPARQNGGKAG